MKKTARILALVFVVTALFGNFTYAANNDEVNIPDPILKQVLLNSGFNTDNDNKMTEAEMKAVDYLPVPDMGIKDLTGLEYCTNNLYKIDISGNPITSIEPLRKLKYAPLVEIDAVGCQISDISPLTDLGRKQKEVGTNIILPKFNFANNKITDISPLAVVSDPKYPKLITQLNLSGNQISDISALGQIPSLEKVEISDNNIIDISAVGSLPKLAYLDISGNQVSDISAVSKCTELMTFIANNTAVTSLAPLASIPSIIQVHVTGNKIADLSAVSNLLNSDVDFRLVDTDDIYSTFAKTKLYKAKKGTAAVTTLKKNLDLIYLGKAGSRFYVAYEGKIGYVKKDAIKIEFDQYLKKKAKKAIVAVKKPNSKKKTKVKFKKNKKITFEAQVGNYYKVLDKNAWVKSNLLKK